MITLKLESDCRRSIPSFATVLAMTALLPARVGSADVSACLPDGAVALEPPSKAKLPDPVPPPNAACVLQSCQDVPAFVPRSLTVETIPQLRDVLALRLCTSNCNLASPVAYAPSAEPSLQCRGLTCFQLQSFMPWVFMQMMVTHRSQL